MKTTKILLMAGIFAVLASCGKSEEEKKAEAEKLKLEATQDSIKKVEMQQLELMQQDSIASATIKGYDFELLSGEELSKYHKTTLSYENLYQSIALLKESAEREMWTEDKLNHMIDIYKTSAKGGLISINVDRVTIQSANTEWFTVIVKDSNDKEIYREKMKSKTADYSSKDDYWHNFGTVVIPERIQAPFFVYFVDQLNAKGPLKYKVTAVK